jgi:hypothetical protein
MSGLPWDVKNRRVKMKQKQRGDISVSASFSVTDYLKHFNVLPTQYICIIKFKQDVGRAPNGTCTDKNETNCITNE